jgi:hypothetical protein
MSRAVPCGLSFRRPALSGTFSAEQIDAGGGIPVELDRSLLGLIAHYCVAGGKGSPLLPAEV